MILEPHATEASLSNRYWPIGHDCRTDKQLSYYRSRKGVVVTHKRDATCGRASSGSESGTFEQNAGTGGALDPELVIEIILLHPCYNVIGSRNSTAVQLYVATGSDGVGSYVGVSVFF